MAERVLERLPEATLIGVDYSTAMLDKARRRLERFERRVRLIEGDVGQPESIQLPEEMPVDVAITVQTLHNVLPEGQRRALVWVGRTLAPGAMLLSLDKIAVPEPLYDLYPALADLPSDFATYEASEAASEEWAPELERQLAWLRAAGLEPAVLHLRANYALVAARTNAG